MKIFILVLLILALFLPANRQSQIKYEPTITYAPQEYHFERNAIYWYALKEEIKIYYVLEMLSISNGALMINVKSKDTVTALKEAEKVLSNVVECMNQDATEFLLEFSGNIDLGSVLIQCMIKNRMHD